MVRDVERSWQYAHVCDRVFELDNSAGRDVGGNRGLHRDRHRIAGRDCTCLHPEQRIVTAGGCGDKVAGAKRQPVVDTVDDQAVAGDRNQIAIVRQLAIGGIPPIRLRHTHMLRSVQHRLQAASASIAERLNQEAPRSPQRYGFHID
ncbi:hypothetical protein FJ543_06100 [Mesorhizobium sp. B2-5-7]|nr:hypothetical protein FJ543_06100 [Mesorhizobium sp. B2-5-7]